MTPTDKKSSESKDEFKELLSNSKNHSLATNNMEDIISNLSKPRFMGSFHMKSEAIMHSDVVDNLIEDELKLKVTKSLKSTIFNPVTKVLILLAIVFNLIWLLFIYVL